MPPLRRYAPLAPALALGVVIAWGDASLADASRLAARRIAATWGEAPGTLWIEGSWGFQHYLREAGGRSIDVRRSILRPGDVVATYTNGGQGIELGPSSASLVEEIEIPVDWVTTMARDTATGFYAAQWGPLPYRFQPGYAERFEVRRLDRHWIFETDPEVIEKRRRELARAESFLAILFALGESGWPAPTPDPAWPRCVPLFDGVQEVLGHGCAWCATVEECETCLQGRADQSAEAVPCTDLMVGAARAWSARCGAWLARSRPTGSPDVRLCARALEIRSAREAQAGS